MASATYIPIPAEDQAALQAQAESWAEPTYQSTVNAINQSFAGESLALDNALANYKSSAEKAKVDVTKSVTNDAIKRGMGRSDQTTYTLTKGLASLEEMVAAYQKETDAKRLQLEQSKNTNLATAEATKNQTVLQQLYNLQQQYIQNYQWTKEYELALKSYGRGGGGGDEPTAEEVFLASNPDYSGQLSGNYYYGGKQVSYSDYVLARSGSSQHSGNASGGYTTTPWVYDPVSGKQRRTVNGKTEYK